MTNPNLGNITLARHVFRFCSKAQTVCQLKVNECCNGNPKDKGYARATFARMRSGDMVKFFKGLDC